MPRRFNVSQIKRYEAGSSQLTTCYFSTRTNVDRPAIWRLQFEAVERLSEEDRRTIASLIETYLKKSQIESIMQAR
jgi:hypothetical protein